MVAKINEALENFLSEEGSFFGFSFKLITRRGEELSRHGVHMAMVLVLSFCGVN